MNTLPNITWAGGWATLLVAPLLLVACAESYDAPKAARQDPLPAEFYPQITVTDELEDDVMVSRVIKGDSAPLAITVVLRNRDTDEHEVQYRFFFLDEKGVPEQADPDWQWLNMPSRTEVFVKSNALDTDARDWQMEIRRAE